MEDDSKTAKLVCLQCQADDQTADAEGFCTTCSIHLCKTCLSYHKRPLPMRHHELVGKDEMPKEQKKLELNDPTNACTAMCEDHHDIIKFYCKSHDVVICSECLNKQHKKCDETPKISDIPNIEEEFQANTRKLNDIEKSLHEIQKKSEEQQVEVQRHSRAAKDEVEKFRKQFNAFSGDLAGKVKSDVDPIEREDDQKMEEIKQNCKRETQKITEMTQRLNKLHEAKKYCDLFVAIKMSAKDVKDAQFQSRQDQARNTIKKYKFVPETRLKDVMRDIKSYGDLVDDAGKEVRQGIPLNNPGVSPILHRAIQVKAGKIEDEEVDVIVNSANIDLKLKQAENTVTTAIQGKAGPAAESSLKLVASGHHPECGDFYDADPGRLKCRRLYHVILKAYTAGKLSKSTEFLADIITKCLKQACESGHKSISFPALGTGVMKYPTDVVARTFLQVILAFFSSGRRASVQFINIVVLSGDKTDAGEEKLAVFERELIREGGKAGVKKLFALPS